MAGVMLLKKEYGDLFPHRLEKQMWSSAGPSFAVATYSNDKSEEDNTRQVQIFQFASVGI